MNILTFISGLLLGGLLPGLLLSIIFKSQQRIVSTFIVSSLLIFHVVFWAELCHIPLTFPNLLIIFSILCGVLALMAGRQRVFVPFISIRCRFLAIPIPRLCVMFITLFVLLFIVRYLAQPLTGWDTSFRWNFLSIKLFDLGTFAFYPPVTPENFKHYFYVDGIPPLCQFVYFWLYASYGKIAPVVTSVFVIPQYLLSVYLCYKITKHLFSKASGGWAIIILCSAPLFFWAAFMGQETGLTTVSFLALTYFLITLKHENRSIIFAGCATALGALSREYGCMFMLYGLLLCARQGIRVKHMVGYVLCVIGLAGPWYARNWIVTGNPVYSNPIGDLFPVNPIHAEILAFYTEVFSFSTNWSFMLTTLGKSLIFYAFLPTVAGLVGCILFFRRFSHLVIGCVMLVALWVYSIGQTAGGLLYSMRILAPVLGIVSILGGAVLERLSHHSTLGKILVVGSLSVICLAGLVQHMLVPHVPWETPVREWLATGFSPQTIDSHLKELQPLFPPGSRVLSDLTYAHPILDSEHLDIVPVWSPEVRFTFDEHLTPPQILQTLHEKHLTFMLVSVRANLFYLDRQPFYHYCFQHLRPLKFMPHSYALFSLEAPE